MSRRELIANLETQAEEIRKEAESKMTVLLDAARALQAMDGDDSPEATAPANGKPSIASLVLGIFTDAPNKVFDAPRIREILLERAGGSDEAETKRIRNGVYASLQQLSTKQKIRRAPGGYELTPPQVPTV